MYSIKEILEEDLEKGRSKKKNVIGRYYPSMLGGCIRKLWYSYKVPKEFALDTLKIFAVGNTMHERIQDIVKKNTPLVPEYHMELKVDDEITVSGYVDLYDKEKKEVYELKTIKSLHYASKPSKHHLIQLMFYMNKFLLL